MASLRVALLVVFVIAAPLTSEALPSFLRRRWTGKDGMVLSIKANSNDHGAPEHWYDQLLDHFDPKNKQVWQQRYWVNASNWDKDSGPVFLFIGGEGEESNEWLQFGEMMDLAHKYKGFAVILEHRFYGKCHPTKDMSLENLRYLSSRQALADMAQFQSFISHEYKMTSRNRWIAYGGSYSGALAAWARIKYPDVFYAAVATSAPVLAEYDFKEYLEIVEDSLLTTMKGKDCVSAIQSAMAEVDKQSKDSKSWKLLEKRFRLESPLKSYEDCELLSLNLAGVFMGVVQYNNDSRGNGIYDMNDLCDVMGNSSLGDPLDRLTALVNDTDNGFEMDASFSMYLDSLNGTSWTDEEFGDRQWFYQTCTEFGYFQTSDAKDQPFGSLISLDLYTLPCEKVFGIGYKDVQKNINSTNDYYGGKNIPKNVTRIVFPNGSVDPWHALGITEDLSSDLPAVFIKGTAHCANMYPSSPFDRKELVEARATISNIVGKWLSA